MPNINRIRVNNVKYNFGTQYYDDFTMRMYGKNTLYDLANGGGKSVLMLLLLQNLIPNCTLDDKQPVEKLFREGCGNTTIHSLIEWKLDPCDVKEGYRYMTTGFCARKAREAEEEGGGSGVASIEYFNYCIFYRQYNRNDIINLPLVKDGERISYQALRNYLKELEHRDIELVVKVFDKKGEYQRFISGYGLHESQWEIVRGINKTEGHVRTYFETNYKTTRKVVEDLLIEEIIEKAFLVKTERDSDGNESMARLLMDIKDQLAVLAGKKKDIAAYGHQTELINLLADKVTSFMDIYQEQDALTKRLADICVTGAEFAENDEKVMAELTARRDEKEAMKNRQKERMECLKAARDKKELEQLQAELAQLLRTEQSLRDGADKLRAELALKESMNDYVDYLTEKQKLDALEAAEQISGENSGDDGYFHTCVHNIKIRTEEKEKELERRIAELRGSLLSAQEQKAFQEKISAETEISLAVAENNRKRSEESIQKLSAMLADVTAKMHQYSFDDIDVQIRQNETEREVKKAELSEGTKKRNSILAEIVSAEQKLSALTNQIDRLQAEEASLQELAEYFRQSKSKLDNILRVYGKGDSKNYSGLKDIIQTRIKNEIISIAEKEQEISECEKVIGRLKEKRIISVSRGAERVMDYIQRRHGIYAMYGMDYISALPDEKKEQILAVNPELPYGVLVQDFETLSEDQNIRDVDTGCESITIYDLEMVESQAVNYMQHAFAVHKSPSCFMDEDTVTRLIRAEEQKIQELKAQLSALTDMLTVEQEDLTFILTYGDDRFTGAEGKIRDVQLVLSETEEQYRNQESQLRELQSRQKSIEEQIDRQRDFLRYSEEDYTRLLRIRELSGMTAEQEELLEKSAEDIKRLSEKKLELSEQKRYSSFMLGEAEGKLTFAEQELENLKRKWNDSYVMYDVPGEYNRLPDTDEVLESKFLAFVHDYQESAKASSDRRLLIETLQSSMKRLLKNIENRGVTADTLEALNRAGNLYPLKAEVLNTLKQNIEAMCQEAEKAAASAKKKQTECSKLEGKIEYAIRNIEAAFGTYQETSESLSEITASLRDGEALLQKLTEEAAACEADWLSYRKEQGYMMDLYKDVKRIVEQNEISLQDAVPIREEKEQLREIFEDVLVQYDKSAKLLERAKNELLRFKGTTAQTLSDMGAFELAATVRDDVLIPASYGETRELLANLSSITGYIALERDRIEKSLVDMELVKQNFEEQCLQRCLDVKTELDKLPKLSRIVLDGEAIQMVGLTIPYVKEEFMRQRMSDYIEKIVSEADSVKDDKERMKYIRNCLALKKLFGVIVTDMNSIRLNLYKRERIREQSRYLRYEEAVGSTGQSQGIYIQFLISIINYISGMYAAGQEDERTKTIFIDNPFGAAKDVYIWEPIFALLLANRVQLIVPARGATPAITGRFDVNYVLGQQMTGERQVTVVVNYTSKTSQEELEYHDLEFEQATFDFI